MEKYDQGTQVAWSCQHSFSPYLVQKDRCISGVNSSTYSIKPCVISYEQTPHRIYSCLRPRGLGLQETLTCHFKLNDSMDSSSIYFQNICIMLYRPVKTPPLWPWWKGGHARTWIFGRPTHTLPHPTPPPTVRRLSLTGEPVKHALGLVRTTHFCSSLALLCDAHLRRNTPRSQGNGRGCSARGWEQERALLGGREEQLRESADGWLCI